jgi:hypothetical protein
MDHLQSCIWILFLFYCCHLSDDNVFSLVHLYRVMDDYSNLESERRGLVSILDTGKSCAEVALPIKDLSKKWVTESDKRRMDMEKLGKEEKRKMMEESCRDLANDLSILHRSITYCQEFDIEDKISSPGVSSPEIYQISFQIFGNPMQEYTMCCREDGDYLSTFHHSYNQIRSY